MQSILLGSVDNCQRTYEFGDSSADITADDKRVMQKQ